jgi:hypothetical protein
MKECLDRMSFDMYKYIQVHRTPYIAEQWFHGSKVSQERN